MSVRMGAAAAHFSLKRRLLGFVLACILVAATALGVNAYRSALHDADAMFDLHLQQMAHSLRGGVPLGLGFDDGDREGKRQDSSVGRNVHVGRQRQRPRQKRNEPPREQQTQPAGDESQQNTFAE